MQKHLRCAGGAFALAAAILSGCATGPGSPLGGQSAEAFNRSMAEAAALVAKNDQTGALRAYQKIAADNPAREDPWAKVAQIHFAQGQYGSALVAAEETLKRDPANRQAKSITAVGGLRLAARSLEELRKDNSLNGDATADAQRLVVLLRENLGQAQLVPTQEKAEPEPRPRPRAIAKRPAVAPAASTTTVAPVHTPTPKPVSGNPLDAFK
jgi:tetratricopeptide (TPR) repeat protein